MKANLCMNEDDVVIAKNKNGEEYYVIGKYDDCFEWDFDCAPVGRFITWHRRYRIGTPHDYEYPSEFWEEVFIKYYDCGDDNEQYLNNHKALAKLLLEKADVSLQEEDAGCYRLHRDRKDHRWIDYKGYGCFSTDNVDKMTREELDVFWEVLKYLDVDEYEWMASEIPDFEFFPVYMYEHSGIALSLTDFSDPWDSGCLGVFCADKQEVDNELGIVQGHDWKQQFHDYVVAVLAEYNEWQEGNVYAYTCAPAKELRACKEAVEQFGEGLWRDNLAAAIVKRAGCWCGNFVGYFEDGIQEYCDCEGLEIIGVLEDD